ncbi:MAG: hypothetical protein CM15mV144_030 [Caudoviricetes sp.]|nr:MAG: hypothetical protein CM15mV144_030 [Caudoviricetes sp.]
MTMLAKRLLSFAKHLEKICKEVIVLSRRNNLKRKMIFGMQRSMIFESSEQFLQYCLANKIKKGFRFTNPGIANLCLT